MKKFILPALFLGAIAFTSCKKDVTCECTTTVDGMDPVTVSTTSNGKKKDLEEACTSASITTETSKVECKVK